MLIFFYSYMYACTYVRTHVHAQRAQRRRTLPTAIYLPSKFNQGCPSCVTTSRRCHCTGTLVPASLGLHSKFFRTGNIFGRRGASENKVTRKFIKRKFCKRKKGKLRYISLLLQCFILLAMLLTILLSSTTITPLHMYIGE